MHEWLVEFLLYEKTLGGMILPEFILVAAMVAISASILLSTVKAIIASRGPARTIADEAVVTIFRQCASCGWEGEIPRLHKVCPKCGDSNFVE